MTSDFFTIIYGQRGQGKSTLFRRIQHTHLKPWCMVDFLWEMPARPQDILLRPKAVDRWEVVEQACLWCSKKRNVILGIDEVDAITKPGGVIPTGLYELAAYGRHFGVGLCLAARRPPDIPLKLAAGALDIYVFRQTTPRDLEYFKALGIPKEAWRGLPDHAFIHLQNGNYHIHENVWDSCEFKKKEK